MSSHAQPPGKATFEPSDQVAVKELRASPTSFRMVAIDVTILVILLGTANYFGGKTDPGWLGVNPSPWLIIPIYLGARHGLTGGITGSIAAVVSILGLIFQMRGMAPIDALVSSPALFSGLFAAGLISGTAHKLVSGHLSRVQSYAAAASRDNLRLAEEVALLSENEAALKESLLMHGAEYTALTEELSQLFTTCENDFESGLLTLLHQHLGVTASAIYSKSEKGNTFTRSTSRGAASTPGEEDGILDPGESRMVSAALLSGKIVAASQMLDDPEAGRSEPILAVIPWGERAGETDSLCMIYRMTFDRIHWETLSRIEAVFDWAMARRSIQMEFTQDSEPDAANRILDPPLFRRRIQVAKVAAKSLNLASRLIIFSPSSDKLDPAEQTRFIEELFESIRTSDSLGGMVSLREDYAIGLLTQLGTDKAAELYASRLRELTGVDGIDFQVYDLFDPVLEATLKEAEERDLNPIAKSAGSKEPPETGKALEQSKPDKISA